MPHCIVEYAVPLAEIIDISELVNAAHQGAIASGLFDTKAIKTRAHPCEHFIVGDDSDNSIDMFVHITLSIMPGRTHKQKNELLESVAGAIASITEQVHSLTIEVRDINQQDYFKKIIKR